MISKAEVEQLKQRPASPGSPVLSVYLDTDQSRAININRAFEVVLKNLLREIEHRLDKKERIEFIADASRVVKYVNDYRDVRRSVAIFADESEDLFWVHDFNVNMRNGAWWTETPYVRPLLELLDDYERYGVVLTDRQHARLFTVFLREIEEHHEAFAEASVKRIKGPGEHGWAQPNIQRKANEHAHHHLKRVAAMMSRLAEVHRFDRMILAGTIEATSELFALLPKALRWRVVRRIALLVDASEKRVLEETGKIEDEIERTREVELVQDLITAAKKRDRAVLGVDDTLLALQEGRVWLLVIADGFTQPGGECTNCGAIAAKSEGACDYCGGTLRGVNDLVELAATRVLDMDGRL